MKNVLVVFLLTLGTLFISCDDENRCTSINAAGTYTGTMECDEMDPVNITFIVEAGDSDIQIIVDGISTTIDDCDIFGSNVVQGTGREIDGDIDGNMVSFVETVKVNGQTDFRCVWRGFKD